MSKLADELEGLSWEAHRKPEQCSEIGMQTIHHRLPEILSALRRVEKLEAALRVAQHDLTTSDNLRATDLTPDQLNDALKRGVPLSDLEWMTDNSKGAFAIRQALTGEA